MTETLYINERTIPDLRSKPAKSTTRPSTPSKPQPKARTAHDWAVIDAEIIDAAYAHTKTKFAKTGHIMTYISENPDKYPALTHTYPKTMKEFITKRLKNAGWEMWSAAKACGGGKVFLIPGRD